MKSDSGMALITALLVVSFLSLIGGALLTSTTLDIRISENYQTHVNLQFLTEAALEEAREGLRVSVQGSTLSALLTTAAGGDGMVSSATDLATLKASDDVAFAGKVTLTDTTGQPVGQYYVYLRNDVGDGRTRTKDANGAVELLAVGVIGDSEKIIELTLKKAFPEIPAALTLNGEVRDGYFRAADSASWEVQGDDEASGGVSDVNAIGIVSSASATEVTGSLIRPERVCGFGTNFPAAVCLGPDVEDVSGELSSELTTPAGLLEIVDSLSRVRTSMSCPGNNAVGSPTFPAIVVVSGDCNVSGRVTRYGLLLVRGSLFLSGEVTWNGLIVVIDDADCKDSHYNLTQESSVSVNGGVLIANTYLDGDDPGPLGEVCVNFSGYGNGGIHYNSDWIRNSTLALPFMPISYREY